MSYRRILLTLSPFLCFIVFLWVPASAFVESAQKSIYIEQLLSLARQKELHKARYWHILLHYEEGVFRTESTIDDPHFFLSPKGKYDPLAELEATIKILFGEELKEEKIQICQFIARYSWLKEELNVDESKVPAFKCTEIESINPKSSLLIFPTYYMNNPASMFGHTLINIKTDYANKLLTKSVNYSAYTEETNGILFAVKGLFGFYKGYYSVLPYYMKIQQYSDISQRDIWEYQLNLTKPELEKMVKHIREMENIYADYYFFDENCSYNLLYLLESARPSAHLTDKFSVWALPIDTIREAEKCGMIEAVEFRPSKASRIRHKISLLSKSSRKIALGIIKGKTEPSSLLDLEISREDRIIISDLVAEYVGYLYAKKKMSKEAYQNIYFSVLKVRSTLGKLKKPYYPPKPPQPDKVRKSRKLETGLGINLDKTFYEIAIRPAFSDLLDTDYGYQQGVQIKFFDTRLRYYMRDEKLVLDRLSAIDILSLSPRDSFFKPLSWKASAGAYREQVDEKKESTIYRLTTGGGWAFYNNWLGLNYAIILQEFRYCPEFEKNLSLGAGVLAGTSRDITEWWKSHLYAEQIYLGLGDRYRSGRIALSQNFIITVNNHLRLDFSREKAIDTYNSEAKINWCLFF